jgi:predicted metal-dependent hydrolase
VEVGMLLRLPIKGLPSYTVRESARAKHLRLKLSAQEGLVVVVPKGFDHDRIPALLESRRSWLEEHARRIGDNQRFLAEEPADVLPDVILLEALGERWSVEYRATGRGSVEAQEQDGRVLSVTGPVEDRSACRAVLRRWLSRKTHEHVAPWLERMSAQTGLAYNRMMVQGQRTRWASCSRHRTISVNYKLLFLPERLVRYVLLHELCHGREMSHSRKYWELLASMSPTTGYYTKRRALLGSSCRHG